MRFLRIFLIQLFAICCLYVISYSQIVGPSGGAGAPNVSNATGILPFANGGTSIAGLGPLGPQNLGTLVNNASLTINWNNGNEAIFQCQGSNTINAPTNPVTNMKYRIVMLSNTTNACNASSLTWNALFLNNSNAQFASNQTGPETNTNLAWVFDFVFDGTNYRYASPSPLQANFVYAKQLNAGNTIASPSFQIASSGTQIAASLGSTIQSSGGTIPTATCSGGSTGVSIAVGSTNNRGSITTSSSASTNCTITWSASGVWSQAPFCVFDDGAASITPTGVSVGACGTSTCVIDFASATSKIFNWICL